jgi:hypothetical protein
MPNLLLLADLSGDMQEHGESLWSEQAHRR